MADFEEQLVRRFIAALDAHIRQIKDAVMDSWPDVEEANFLANGTILNLKAQSQNEERIDFGIAYVGVASPANGGLITLGDADKQHQIPIQGGVVTPFDCKIRLKNTSIRQIQTVVMTNNSPSAIPGPAGYLYLALFGREIPVGQGVW